MASSYLTKAFSNAGNQQIFTISFWHKKEMGAGEQFPFAYAQTAGGASSNRGYFAFQGDGSANTLKFGFNPTGSSWTSYTVQDNGVNMSFRDTSAWFNVVLGVDTTQATAANRMKIYINGVQKSFDGYPAQNFNTGFNQNTYTHDVGSYPAGRTNGYLGGNLAHFHFIDGTAYAASTFGEIDSTSGIWKPKTLPSVTYGSNGFFLKFENSGAMGTDSSGNSNTFSIGGTITQNTDTPTNNFTVLNAVNNGAAASTLTNGNLTYSLSNYSHNTRSTMALTAGKYYWEQKQSDINSRIGLCTSGFRNDLDTDSTDAIIGGAGNGGLFLIMSAAGTSWQLTNNNTSRSVTTYTNAIASSANDILMGAVDVDAGKLWIGVNGTWFNSGNPATAATPTLTFTNNGTDPLQVYAGFGTDSARVVHYNFGSGFFGTTAVASANADANGHGAFEYAVPSGFYAICTKNIKEFG